MERSLQAALVRYRVNVPTGRVTMDPITDTSVEFPRGNPHNDNRPYRYTYALSINTAVPNDAANQLVKVDVTTGDTEDLVRAGVLSRRTLDGAAPRVVCRR